MNGQTRARQPEGTPAGGQFAATARTEADVSLTPPAQLTSSDGIEGYQHPRHVARFDAITAFNDILQNVALSLRAVAGTLRDGGLNVEDTQAGMRKSRESMEQFINSIAGAGTE